MNRVVSLGFPVAVAIALGCSAGAEGQTFGAGGQGGDGGVVPFDTGYTGDGEITGDSACAVETLQAEAVPLDMMFMLDTSGSMTFNGKLTALQAGVVNFLNDPESVGIGATGQRFPIPEGTDPDVETCDAGRYAISGMPWATLPYPGLVDWVNALTSEGTTPTVPALQGAVDACRARQLEQPANKCAVVLVTDGEPEGRCAPVGIDAQAPLGAIAAQALAEDIAVFAIGFPGIEPVGQAVLHAIASNGGTDVPTLIQAGNVGQDFIDALMEIRGTALGCEYKMPTVDGRTVNPEMVKIEYTPGDTGTLETIPRVMSLSTCGGSDGWSYDNNTLPTRLVMCPNTCDRMLADDAGRVQILLGCTSNQR